MFFQWKICSMKNVGLTLSKKLFFDIILSSSLNFLSATLKLQSTFIIQGSSVLYNCLHDLIMEFRTIALKG